MQIVESIGNTQSLTIRQRWSYVFTILVGIAMILFGLNLKNSIQNANASFSSSTAGIQATYPRNWLLDTVGDYVFRVRDMSRTGFKPTFQVTIIPVGSNSTERNVASRLNLDRLQTFPLYTVLSNSEYTDSNLTGQAISYTYVTREGSPFLETIPLVVRGMDVIVIRGGQAVIITFRTDTRNFDTDLPRFEEFIRGIRF